MGDLKERKMEGRVLSIRRLVSILLSMTLLASCTAARVYVGVVRARNDYAQGDYQAANRRLIGVGDLGAFEPWIAYNLGTVYYALGEPGSAAEIWSTTSVVESSDLAFHLEYNRGVLKYEVGEFAEAYRHFRTALELDPTSVEAKANLEFAIEKLSEEKRQEESDTTAEAGEEVDRILHYLERIERDFWESTERIEPRSGVRDW